MFKDEHRYGVWERIRQQDLRVFARWLSPELFRQASQRSGVRIVRSPLALPNLVWLGIASAIHGARSFACVLSLTVRTLEASEDWQRTLSEAHQRVQPSRNKKARSKRHARGDEKPRKAQRCGKHRPKTPRRSKHSPHGRDPADLTEEAFCEARRRMPPAFWIALILLLAERFESQHAELVRWKRFRLLSLDGTTLRLPQTAALAEHFGTSRNGKSRTVQARMVMVQFPLVRLPWRYELVPLAEGERTVAHRLLKNLRRDDLILMDQGFWSYGLFHQVQAAGAFFAIRLYPGVKLRRVRRLGPKDRVVRWRKPTGPRWRGDDLPPTIDLRVIDYQIKGFRPSAVVTNALDPRKVSREEWVRMATAEEPGRRLDQGRYHRRWEIETSFSELKVRQGMGRSLRSRTPESIRYEVAGHVVLYLLVRWLMVEAARKTPDADPLGLSFSGTLEELLTLWPLLVIADPADVSRRLLPLLLKRIAMHVVPWRPGRHYPRPHDTNIKNCGRGKRRLPNKLKPPPK